MILQAVSVPKLNVSKKFWISLGLVCWLYFVVSHLPAVWGAYALTRSGDIAMSGVSGTLWSGRASLASIKLKGIDHSLGQVTWDLNFFSLFTFKLCALVTTQMDNQQFDGYVCTKGKNAFLLKDTTMNFPAALVQPMLPLPIDGQFAVTLDALEIDEGKYYQARGKVTWVNGKINNGSNWMAVGTLGADLKDDGKNGLTAQIVDIDSPLRVNIESRLPYPTGATVKGNFAMPENYFHDADAGAWLSMFAIQQANDAQGNLTYSVDLNF